MNKNIPLKVAAIVFGLIALIHLLRVIYNWQIVVSGYVMPMGISYVGFLLALGLSIWMFAASKK